MMPAGSALKPPDAVAMHRVVGAEPAGIGTRALRSLATIASGVVAAVSGIAPHVLHHVGPLAGAALLAGVGGTILFGVAGFALSIPMLLRLRSPFGTWAAPAMASVIFTSVYLISALVLGPSLIADRGTVEAPMSTPAPTGHAGHH